MSSFGCNGKNFVSFFFYWNGEIDKHFLAKFVNKKEKRKWKRLWTERKFTKENEKKTLKIITLEKVFFWQVFLLPSSSVELLTRPSFLFPELVMWMYYIEESWKYSRQTHNRIKVVKKKYKFLLSKNKKSLVLVCKI